MKARTKTRPLRKTLNLLPILSTLATHSNTSFFIAFYEWAVLVLLVLQYSLVILLFTTYTQNIVIIKDLLAPFFSVLILGTWITMDLALFGSWKLPQHPIVKPMVIGLLVWLTTVFTSPVTAASIEAWTMYFSYFVIAWAILRFATTRNRIQTLIFCIIGVNFFTLVYGLSQLRGADFLILMGVIPNWGRDVYVSTFGNQNFFSGYLVATFPLILGYWFYTKNRFIAFCIPFLVSLTLWELIEARGFGYSFSVLAIVPFLLGTLIWNQRTILSYLNRSKKVIAIGFFLLCVAVIGQHSASSSPSFMKAKKYVINSTIVVPALKYKDQFSHRFRMKPKLTFWRAAIDGGIQSQWFGKGIGGFNHYMPESRPSDYHRNGVSHNTMHAHADYFEWFMETGVIGVSIFLWIILVFIISTIRAARHFKNEPRCVLILFGLLGIIASWISDIFTVSSRWTSNGVALWFLVGIVAALTQLPRLSSIQKDEPEKTSPNELEESAPSKKLTPSFLAIPFGVIFAILFFGFTVMLFRFWLADHYLRNNMAYTDTHRGSGEKATNAAVLAQRYNYSKVSNYYKLAYLYLSQKDMNKAMTTYRVLQSFSPNYAQIHINLAFLNDQMGYRQGSAWERDRSAVIEHNTRNHRDAALYCLQLGYPKRAVAHLRICLTIERDRSNGSYINWMNHDDIRFELAQIYLNDEDRRDQSIKELKLAQAQNPANEKVVQAIENLLTVD